MVQPRFTTWMFVAAAWAFTAASPASAETSEVTTSCDSADCVPTSSSRDTGWRTPKRLRTALELGGVLGLGATWYWIERDRQVADWDFPSIRDRFRRDNYVNDSNSFPINYVWHSLGGLYYHVAARSNDLGLLESTAFGLGASLAWEYGIEFREKISLNDILFTTGAGVAVGEFVHWLGRKLQEPGGGVARDAARWSIGVMQSAHDTIDGRRIAGPAISRVFRISSGYAHASARTVNGDDSDGRSNLANLRFQGQLTALGDLLAPGRRQSSFRDGNITRLDLHVAAGPAGTGVYALADTFLFAKRHEDIPFDGDGIGYGVAVGSAVAARYQDESYEAWRDRLGAVHLPGIAVDAALVGNGWSLRGLARAHVDYGGVHAMTYARWYDANPTEVGKAVLAEQGYYYAWGASARASAELTTRNYGIGAAAFHGRYWSQQGFDRFQSELTVDQIGHNRYTDLGIWIRRALFDGVYVELRRDTHYRFSDLEGFEGTSKLARRTLELGTYF